MSMLSAVHGSEHGANSDQNSDSDPKPVSHGSSRSRNRSFNKEHLHFVRSRGEALVPNFDLDRFCVTVQKSILKAPHPFDLRGVDWDNVR